eukprot:3754354-Prymnesium_polylepis.2
MDTVRYDTFAFESFNEFEVFMNSPMPSQSMGGLVEVDIGCYRGVDDCFAHVFCFAVVQSPFGGHHIIACDRGKACDTFAGSHIEEELISELEDRRLSWPQFMSLYAESNPGAPMREKSRAWKRSRLFSASVTLLLDDNVKPRFKLSKLESLHHRISS